MALILATAIWLVVRAQLISEGVWDEARPRKARTLSPEEQQAIEEELEKSQQEGQAP